MTIQAIRAIAKKLSVKVERQDKIELIKSIQRAEGNKDCFATRYVQECNQLNCLWLEDCLKIVSA
jgi:hypothetical protein